MYFCMDCREFFDEPDERAARLEDCCLPWSTLPICPFCGGDEIYKAPSCRLCGRPIEDWQGDFCKECADDIDEAFIFAADLLSFKYDVPFKELLRLMFDRAESANWYEAAKEKQPPRSAEGKEGNIR